MTSNTKLSIWLVATALCAAAVAKTNAEDIPSCASNLASCFPYLNSTSKPPPTCCIPLKMVIETQLQCLCNLYNTGLNGGNVSEAFSLAARCGISNDLSLCGTAPPPDSSTSPPPTGTAQPPSSSTSPPPTGTAPPPGSSTSPPPTGVPGNPSGAGKIIASSAGFLGVVLFLVSIILN